MTPIPQKAWALAAKGLQREADRMNAVVKKAEGIAFDRRMEQVIRKLARL